MMILWMVSRGGYTSHRASSTGQTYSSRIQLPTEAPPQLIPVTILPAKLSLRGLSRFDAFMDIGCAPLCDPDMPPLNESRCPKPDPVPLDCPAPTFMADEDRDSFPVVV